MRRRTACPLVLALVALAPEPAAADLAPRAYDRGTRGVEVLLGAARLYGDTSFLAGVRVGYFVLPGLELAVAGAVAFRDDPMMGYVAFDPRYVLFPVDWRVRPYVGAFYRRWLVEQTGDPEGVGASIGLVWRYTARGEVGFGTAVEYALDCRRDCVRFYPTTHVRMSF